MTSGRAAGDSSKALMKAANCASSGATVVVGICDAKPFKQQIPIWLCLGIG